MDQDAVHENIVKLVEPFLEGLGMELVHLEYRPARKGYLCIYIDKPGGVTLEDCETASRGVSELLDAYDPVPHSYVLEVSSPGVERPLVKRRDYERFRGEPVKVATINPIEGSRKFTGILETVEDDDIVLRLNDGSLLTVTLENISKAHLRFMP